MSRARLRKRERTRDLVDGSIGGPVDGVPRGLVRDSSVEMGPSEVGSIWFGNSTFKLFEHPKTTPRETRDVFGRDVRPPNVSPGFPVAGESCRSRVSHGRESPARVLTMSACRVRHHSYRPDPGGGARRGAWRSD